MSEITQNQPSDNSRYARNVYEIAEIISERYHDFAHNNKKNPLWELLFIICSIQTDERGYVESYKKLRLKWPRLGCLAQAKEEELAATIREGGLSKQKAAAIWKLLDEIIRLFGKPSLAPLVHMADKECEELLVSLPGVGKKTARCVMMYALGRYVFPVDIHCWRIARRIGWVRPTRKDGSSKEKDMDRLQDKIPPEIRFSLHVNFVSLGREFCTARNPDCSGCPISSYCRRVGIPIKSGLSGMGKSIRV